MENSAACMKRAGEQKERSRGNITEAFLSRRNSYRLWSLMPTIGAYINILKAPMST